MDKFADVPFSFDQDYMKRVKKADFIKAHAHLKDVIKLDSYWDHANAKKEPDPEEREV